MTYINTRTYMGVETIDELDPKDFNTTKDFRKELNRLINEYKLTGQDVYPSRRSTAEWKERH